MMVLLLKQMHLQNEVAVDPAALLWEHRHSQMVIETSNVGSRISSRVEKMRFSRQWAKATDVGDHQM